MTIHEKIYNLCKKYDNGISIDKFSLKTYSGTYFKQIFELENFNKLYKLLKKSKLRKIIRTEKGNIIKSNFLQLFGSWDIQKVITKQGIFKGVILTVILKNTLFIFKSGSFGTNKNKELTGKKAFSWFLKYLKEDNIDINNYAIDNGADVKLQIESPIIENCIIYQKLTNVNHLDFNSAWASKVVKKYPEFKNAFYRLYHEKNKEYPSIVLGYMQSEYCNYKFTHLSKIGVNDTNKEIKSMVSRLFKTGYEIVGINTDGIWYRDLTGKNRIYHDENEGTEFGQWRTDHINCEFMAYSDGQYWFKENGVFYPKARGFYSYELIKPREQWDENDFDKAMSSISNITWDDEEGFIFDFDRENIL